MKLSRALLEKVIELPFAELTEIRHLLDDLGLEVKNIEGEGVDTIFTIETLANRGDHLSAVGVAREISARLLTSLKLPAMASELSSRKTSLPVKVATDKCLRYALMEMSLPKDMALRTDVAQILRNPPPGERHAIVHLLNFIQQELGQPMHAFDRDKVEGEISVELTATPESIEALDGKTYKVPPGSLVIKDKRRIIAVAGVIGCANSMVTADTTKVLIESASFDPVAVRLTARAMGLSTDASHAFERGVDRELVLAALKRLVYLTEGAGGAIQDATIGHAVGLSYIEGAAAEKRRVVLRLSEIRRHMNAPRLNDVEVTTRLKHLGFVLEPLAGEKGVEKEFMVTVPSWRLWDIRNSEDLVEEFGRAHGLNKVKLELPPLDYEQPEPNDAERLLAKVEPVLLGNGFLEVITKGMYPRDTAEMLAKLDPEVRERHITLKNSVDSAYSHMKVTNLVSLCQMAEQNLRRGVVAVKAYEFGRVFGLPVLKDEPYEYERELLSLVVAGRWNDHEWRKPESLESVVYLFRGVLESLVNSLGGAMTVAESKHPFLHPGYQASIRCGRVELGVFGVVHPIIRDRLELSGDVVYAELEATKLLKIESPSQLELPSDFPTVRRDMTLKVGLKELAGRIVRIVTEGEVENLAEVQIVDNFRKPEEDFRRVTFRLTFKSKERTLAHAEVDAAMTIVMGQLARHQIELCG